MNFLIVKKKLKAKPSWWKTKKADETTEIQLLKLIQLLTLLNSYEDSHSIK
jgi:hypothetical protein